jgi:ATP-dependent Clp protease ATP-binding subunit ClpX
VAKNKSKVCDFCGTQDSEKNPVIEGQNEVSICKFCAKSAYDIIDEHQQKSGISTDDEGIGRVKQKEDKPLIPIPPKELKKVLDDFVVGQDHAKKVLGVAIYNHYKRLITTTQNDNDINISKSNVLFIGATGSGKTLLAQTVAKYLDVPFAIADATSLTEAGYVGDDVENIVTRLLQAADGDVARAEKGIIFIDEIDKIARMGESRSITRDVSGEGVQQAMLKIIEGSVVNVPPKGGRKHPNADSVAIDTANILFICGGAFDGISEIIQRRMGKNILGFNQSKKTKSEIKNNLAFVEPDDLVSYGLIPELIGRLHNISVLSEITKEIMIKILKEPKDSILKQYQKLFSMDNIELSFEDEALDEIAELAMKRKTGARGLRAILEEVMLDFMYELPNISGLKNNKLLIKKDDIVKIDSENSRNRDDEENEINKKIAV